MRALPTVMIVALAALLVGCGSGPAPSTGSRYVALGDSNTSGAGLPTPATGAPKNCFRTESGYPSLAANDLAQDVFVSVACSGAGISAFATDMAHFPDEEIPPQFNALSGNETVVSVTIGDNDAGFGEVTETCLKAKRRSDTPCQDKYVTSDGNKMTEAAAALAKPLGEALDAIRDRSPKAKIFVLGYGQIIPEDGKDCWGKVNVSASDAPYFYGWQNAITTTEKATAEAHGAIYVDFFDQSKGHDACQPADRRWTNPMNNFGDAGWPLHPTLEGSRAAAAALANAWNRSKLGR